MTLGSHYKNRIKSKQFKTVDEFIEDANNIDNSKEAVKKPSQEDILLTFAGKIDREKECEKKPVLLYLKKDIANDIAHYCHGNKQGIMNYLLRKGLDELIKNNKLQLIIE
ncbi:hypothetical protein ACQUW5_13300 [Legionella sp. CNM-1927-20]|uniref:hypothetical protein n=1 Tax=Legionella sp. CNM-1927-20 TaxID=3422221 RepID=UPI00403B0117